MTLTLFGTAEGKKVESDLILFETVVGSHVWGMETGLSDTDTFRAYIVPSITILNGTAETKSKFIQIGDKDIAQHEIGKVINQILKGNINFLIGVMSPLCVLSGKEHKALKEIVVAHLAKNCFHSIHGMAAHNYKKYIDTGKDTSERRCNTILRGMRFGERILEGKGIVFERVKGGTPMEIKQEFEILNESFSSSKLPEIPEEKPFRDWLLSVRLSNDLKFIATA